MNQSLKVSIFIIIIFFFANPCQGQKDTSFWLALPEIPSSDSNHKLGGYMTFISYEDSAIVSLSKPAKQFYPWNFTLAPHSKYRVDYSFFKDQTKPANNILNTGIHIKSSSPVSILYELPIFESKVELFSLKGRNGLGTHFIIPSQTQFNNVDSNIQANNSFDIVATENQTLITITPKNAIIGNPAEKSFTITLNKGQTYSAVAISKVATKKLAGSEISSNKPISITVKDAFIYNNNNFTNNGKFEDFVGDQIVPSRLAGLEFIAPQNILYASESHISIVTMEDSTEVFINGASTPLKIFNKGDALNHILNNESSYIKANKPVLIWHTLGLQNTNAGAILPKLNCAGSYNINVSRNWNLGNERLAIIVRKEGIGNFTIDDMVPDLRPYSFKPVEGTNNEWYISYINFRDAIFNGSIAKIKNSSHQFHLAYADGSYTRGSSFAFLTNYSNNISSKSSIVLCDSLVLKTKHPGSFYTWSNGSQEDSITVNSPGTYYVNYLSSSNCQLTDSFLVLEHPNYNYEKINDTVVCEGSTLNIKLELADSILWSDRSTVSNRQFKKEGTYSFRTLHSLCPINDTFEFKITRPNLDLGENKTFCDSIDHFISISDTFKNYLWNDGLQSSFRALKQHGTYWLETIDKNNCKARDSITLSVYKTNQINLGEDTSICRSNHLILSVNGFINYLWQDGSSNNTYLIKEDGLFHCTAIDSNDCQSKDTIIISINPNKTISNIFIPNAFSPNNDGLNDQYPFNNTIKKSISEYSCSIYTRWGEQIFFSQTPTANWNGTHNNKDASQGTYIYLISFKGCNGLIQNRKGNFTLLK